MSGSFSLRGLGYLALAVVAVQGTAYLFQLLVAALLSPSEFGVVRSVDAVLSLFLIVGSAGMPSLAVKCVAELGDRERRGRLLGRLLGIAAGAGLISASLAYVLAPWLGDVSAAAYLQRLAWIIPVAACARTALNYYQGAGAIHHYSVLTVSVAFGAFLPSLLAVWMSGLSGWIWARYGLETLTLSAALLPLAKILRGSVRLAAAYSRRRLTRLGSVLSLSLLTRTSLDNLGTLALVASGAHSSQIGYYGIGVLVVLALLILPACVGSMALPELVQRVGKPTMLRATFVRSRRMALLLTLPVSVLAIAIGPWVVRHFFPAYIPSIPVIQTLLATVPARAMTTVSGTLLVALDRGGVTLVTNAVILSLGAVLMLALTPSFGIIGAAWATVGVEATSAVLYGLLANRQLSESRVPA